MYARGDEMDDEDERELIPDLEEPNGGQSDHHTEDQARDSEVPNQTVRAKLASHGISSEVPAGRRLSEAIRHGLVKAHCNLGHPSKEDLARFLKLGGCVTCANARRPSTHRPTNIPPCQSAFGNEVQLDCVCILPSRYVFRSVFRNKNAGLLDADGNELPVKAKARLCLQGHLCPDSRTGQVQVDSRC